MRVRISFDALRLCLLVAAGVTSGYLWRAAFESSSPVEQRVAATPRIVEQAPAPPVVRIPHHLTATKRPAVVVPRAVSRAAVERTHPAPTTLVSSHVAAAQPVAKPASTPPPPKPSPPPKPAPAPVPTSTTPTPSSPPVSAAVQQSAAPPTTTTTPLPPPTVSGDDGRPGWGKGDKNHDHDGPGGKKP
jgi:hypothetical protein